MKLRGIQKSFLVFLLVTLVLSFAGCGNTGSNVQDTTSQAATGEATTQAVSAGQGETAPESKFATPGKQKYDTPVTVTSVRVLDPTVTFAQGEDIENNIWTKAALEEYGIVIKYKWTAPTAQYPDKISLMLASNDIPDFFNLDVSSYELAMKSGLLGDLTDAYKNYASQALMERMSLDENAIKAGTSGGKLYALAQAQDNVSNGAQYLWLRNDWLKKLNLSAPKTIDELIEVARAMKDKDPDGNSKKDTYGVGISQAIGFNGLYNGFNAYKGIWMPDSAGKLVYGSVQPEMKEALSKIQQMFKEGLIDKDYYTKSYDNAVQDLNTNKVGVLYDNFITPLRIMDGWDKDHSIDWEPYTLPSVKADSYPAVAQIGNGFGYYIVARKGWEHPEAMVKLVNMFVDKQSNAAEYIQDKDARWVFMYAPANISTPENNSINQRLIAEAIKKNDPSGLPIQAKQNYDNIQRFNSGSVDKMDYALTKIFAPESTLSFLDENYINTKHYMQDKWYKAPTPSMVKKQAALKDLEEQTFTKIIMGASISEFDKFVENWKKMGGDDITKEVNESYQNVN